MPRPTPAESQRRAAAFHESLLTRRTVRAFSPDPIPEGVLQSCLATAHSAPSGANLQPWHFALVQSPETKHRLRRAAEAEEQEFYESRTPEDWLQALQSFATDWHKPFLLLVTGYPAPDHTPPVLKKLPLAAVTSLH